MAQKYKVKPEFEILRPIVMPMNRHLISIENILLHMTMFLVVIDTRVRIRKIKVPVRDGHVLKVWTFTPKNLVKDSPSLVYFPGGGFMMGPNFGHKRNAAKIALEAGCKIFLVPYRLAPKWAFPTALFDAYDSFNYIHDHAEELNIDPNRIAMGGDSAGGTLTAGATAFLRDTNRPVPILDLLLYPAMDRGTADFPSRHQYQDTPMFNTKRFEVIEKYYYKNGFFGLEKYAFPLTLDTFVGLPSVYIETAEFDCLHDDGIRAAEVWKKAGNEVTLVETKGTFHGYDAIENSPVTKDCMRRRVAALRKAFGLDPVE
jgi:acetyl esterase/lipase